MEENSFVSFKNVKKIYKAGELEITARKFDT